MDRFNRRFLLFVLIILLDSPIVCHSWGPWGWFSSSSSSEEKTDSSFSRSINSNAEFSIEVFSDKKAVQRLENAKNKLVGPNSCWQNAYGYLMAGCKDMVSTEEQRKRFAWHLSDCFQKESGRPDFPSCNDKSTMMSCLKKLDDHEHKIYLEFMLETNTICQQLQSYAFKNEIERLVNDLRRTAQNTEDKLDILESKSDDLLQSTSKIHESVGSIDVVVQNVAHKTNTIGTQISGVSLQTKEIYQEQKSITESQLALREGQEKMGEAMKAGMEMFNDTVSDVKIGVDRLKNDTKQIGGKINLLGEKMTEKMSALENQTSVIGTMTNSTLDKQQKLLEGQSVAIDSIQSLNQFQSEALAKRQEQLQQVHDHLFENSKSMLAAQEAFEAKQASMFVALDKLFALHNAMLVESRVIKAFFIYFFSTLALEVASLRYVNDAEHRAWIINLVRSLFAALASAQLLHAAFTYRDYEVLNHNILLRLVDTVNSMQSKREISWDEDTDSEVDWKSWIDADITDDGDSLGDPDYKIPEDYPGFTSSMKKRLYNLRPR